MDHSTETATTLCHAPLTTTTTIMSSSVSSTRKSVRFHPEVTTIDCSSSPRLLKEEAEEELWYLPCDLEKFKKAAANIIISGKNKHTDGGDEDDVSGLERYTSIRAKPKMMAIKCILLAQKQNVGHEFVALVSQECSALATELAFSQGFQDYCQAYSSSDHCHYSCLENKRTREQLDLAPQEEERRGRQRIFLDILREDRHNII
jgi:hypothetical protein